MPFVHWWFYTSPSLAKFVLDNKTDLAGTIRVNRYNFPKDIKNEPLEKGVAICYISTGNPMTACKHRADKDKASGQLKVVFMLSLHASTCNGKRSLVKLYRSQKW